MTTPIMTQERVEELKKELEAIYKENPRLFYCQNMVDPAALLCRLNNYWKHMAREGCQGYVEWFAYWRKWRDAHVYEGEVEQPGRFSLSPQHQESPQSSPCLPEEAKPTPPPARPVKKARERAPQPSLFNFT